jgi:hypothetical protein
MLEVAYHLLKKLTFHRIEIYAFFSEPLEHFSQFCQGLVESAANYDYVI